MAQPQSPRVEHRSVETGLAPTVIGVARHRMTHRRQVDPDLVRAPGVEITAQKRMGSLPLDDPVARARIAAACDDCHALALPLMAADRPLQLARVVLHPAARDGEIRAAQRPVTQLRGECTVRDVVARRDDETRRSLVQAMHDSGPRLAAARRPVAAAAQKSVDERAPVMTRRWVQ